MIIVGQEKPPLDELAHVGVKGMKWGVRKSTPPSKSSGNTKFKNKNEADEYVNAILKDFTSKQRRARIIKGAARAGIILAIIGGRLAYELANPGSSSYTEPQRKHPADGLII